MDLISIIVPVYNVENYLEKCLESIINQTYRNLEIIVVNDGSTDSSLTICNHYRKIDSRVKVINQRNQGLSAARIAGFNKSTGKYINFIDSDDFLPCDFVEIMYQLMVNKSAQIVVCDVNYIFYQKEPKKMLDLNQDLVIEGNYNVMKSLVPITGGISNYLCNKMYDRNILSVDILDYNHKFEDVATMYKILSKVDRLVCTSRTFYNYLIRNYSITQSLKADFINFDLIEANKDKYLGIKNLYPTLSQKAFHQYAISTIYYYNVAIKQKSIVNKNTKLIAKEVFDYAIVEKYWKISKTNFIKLFFISKNFKLYSYLKGKIFSNE